MNPMWRWFLPGYVLALPGTVLGLLLFMWYWPRSVRLSDGCIEVIPRMKLIGGRWVGAQTFGHVIYYRDERMRDLDRLRVHERVHVWQSMIMSWPIFMLFYGAHWLVLLVTQPGDWKDAYRKIWAEEQAYRIDANHKPGEWGTK